MPVSWNSQESGHSRNGSAASCTFISSLHTPVLLLSPFLSQFGTNIKLQDTTIVLTLVYAVRPGHRMKIKGVGSNLILIFATFLVSDLISYLRNMTSAPLRPRLFSSLRLGHLRLLITVLILFPPNFSIFRFNQ